MKKLLQEKFVENLLKISPKKEGLSSFVADALHIEKESALRRINGKVNFSINEMGVLAQKFDISLDQLLIPEAETTVMIPLKCVTFNSNRNDYPVEFARDCFTKNKRLLNEPLEMGIIFSTLPVQFLVFYPHLCKFHYFKLGRYYGDPKTFSEYAAWELPQNLTHFLDDVSDVLYRTRKALYIWNHQVIYGLVNDLRHFYTMGIIGPQDAVEIKKEIHQFLYDMEAILDGTRASALFAPDFQLYVSKIDLGITCLYYLPVEDGEVDCSCLLTSFFQHAYIYGERANVMKSWVQSMKYVSTLISLTGEADRVLFFKEQHHIVEHFSI